MNAHERRRESRQLAHEGTDWLYNVLGAALIVALVLAATVGHAWVSARVAHGQGMPELRTDLLMPYVSR